jgi:hypothetical protein
MVSGRSILDGEGGTKVMSESGRSVLRQSISNQLNAFFGGESGEEQLNDRCVLKQSVSEHSACARGGCAAAAAVIGLVVRIGSAPAAVPL